MWCTPHHRCLSSCESSFLLGGISINLNCKGPQQEKRESSAGEENKQSRMSVEATGSDISPQLTHRNWDWIRLFDWHHTHFIKLEGLNYSWSVLQMLHDPVTLRVDSSSAIMKAVRGGMQLYNMKGKVPVVCFSGWWIWKLCLYELLKTWDTQTHGTPDHEHL